MKIIYCGDVVGRAGREAVLDNIPYLKEIYNYDLLVVNAENSAHGFGVSTKICEEFFRAGVDVITTGNHVWNQREVIPYLNDCKKIIRPINYPKNLPGRGYCEVELDNGKKVIIAQALGRLHMEAVDCPIQAMDELLRYNNLGKNVAAIFVDIHAEITSEKVSFGHYLDGRVSAVVGTHTHIPTADAQILENGTAYMTDVGMCGDYNSVLGSEKSVPVDRLARKYTGGRLSPATGKGSLCAVMVDIDDRTGLANEIKSIKVSPQLVEADKKIEL